MADFQDKPRKDKRGNPAWYRGMPPTNPKGRPRNQTSIEAFYRDPQWFCIEYPRWKRFCLELPLTAVPGNGAEAARRAGYSPKSARFIASRLRKKPIVREMLRELNEITSSKYQVWLRGERIGLGIFQRQI
jgi:hypothetical protein